MLAPKALKSDKDQIGSVTAPDGSSSEFSEDDTPLAVRLNSQGTSRENDVGKHFPRPVLPKKGGFVIPRKKKQANELLQVSNFNTRDGKELLRNVVQSYRDPNVGASFKFETLELICNDELSREFQEKKLCMRSEWRTPRELEDKHAFFYTLDRDEAKKICEVGLEVGSTSISCLGDPSMGVYLCRHADVISKNPLPLCELGYLIVFKVIKGKVKPVTERTTTAVTDLLEPTPNFDCHVSKSIQSLPASSPLSQVFEYSQYYFYEFAEEGDDLHVKRPRQCLPYALVTFRLGDSSSAHQESFVAQDENLSVENNGLVSVAPSVLRQGTRIMETRQGRSSLVLWQGKLANKERILSCAQLVCHSVEKVKLPFNIGEKIVMKEKISFQQLKPFLTFPLFRAGPPSVTKTCKASLAGGLSFLHCDLLPVEDDNGKIKKLVKFFQEKNWAGIVKCPDANRVIFLIPTSQITLDLGITTVDSPPALHVLLFVKNLKTSKGSTPTRSKVSREVKTVSQIQNELKRQFSDVKEVHTPTEQRSLSQESARPKFTSACTGNKMTQDSLASEYEKELTSEQAVSWKNAVESWLSRPHPLGGTDVESQRTAADSSVTKANKLSSSSSVPKPRMSAALLPVDASLQEAQAKTSSSTEQHKTIPAKHVDGSALKQLKSDSRVAKQDSRPPAVPLVTRKVEHREDPRLKRRSLDAEPSPELKSPQPLVASYSMPYNAQNALQAQGVIVASNSVETSTTTSSVSSHGKNQLNDESIRSVLDKILPKQRDSGYQVNLDDGTIRALELIRQQESKRRNSDPEDEGSRILKQKEDSRRRKSGSQDRHEVSMDTNTSGKSVATVRTSDEKSVKKNHVSATQDQHKKRETDQVNTVGVNVPVLSAQEQGKEHSESRKGKRQVPADMSEKKRPKVTRLEKSENHDVLSESSEKPVLQSVVPELSEDSFPAISAESLKTSKIPPKLILRNKTAKETSAQLAGENTEPSEYKIADQPREINSQKDDQDQSALSDIRQNRKSLESPVAMDISPQCTTPSALGTVSPITVVSAKGRYTQTAPPPVAPTTPVHSSPVYPSPVSSTYPFSPPVPQGPYRSPISPVLPPGPMQFGPSSTPVASSESLPGVHPISSLPSAGPAGFIPPSQTVSAFPPTSAIPPVPVPPVTSVAPGMGPATGSPSFPVPPPAHPGIIERKNSADPIPSATSPSPGSYPPAFPGQQWTSLPRNQGFGFLQTCPPLPRSALPPAIGRPPVFPQQLGGLPQVTPLPGPPVERPVVQPQGVGFVPIAAPRFPALPGTPQVAPFGLPQGPRPLAPMGPAPPQLRSVTGTPQMIQPMFGTIPQFLPRVPFQVPSMASSQRPLGYWEAPLMTSAVSTTHMGRPPPHHSSGQKHLKESTASVPSQKSSDPGKCHAKKDIRAKNNIKAKNVIGDEKLQESSRKENSSDSKGDASVQVVNEDKPSTQEKLKEAVESKPNVSGDCETKSKKLNPADSVERKTSESGMPKNEPKEVLVMGSAEEKGDARNVEKLKSDETHMQELGKLTSDRLTQDSVCIRDKHSEDAEEAKVHDNDSAKKKDGVDLVTRSKGNDIEPPSKVIIDERQNCSFQDMSELSDDRTKNLGLIENSGKLVKGNRSFASSSVTDDYLTEAEQTSTKARSKIFDILRRNAYDSRSETDSADQGPEDQDEPDKPDEQDYKPDADMEEGAVKEEKLLFSGEESTTSEHGIHLESGLRVVQVLDLGESESDKERSIRASSTVESSKTGNDGKTQGEHLGKLSKDSRRRGSHKKHSRESSPKNIGWEDISDASDEGTPERDLPGFGSIDIEFKQLRPKTVETTHVSFPESTDAEAAPKPEKVAHVEADSSVTIMERVKAPSRKRRRWNSTSEGSDMDELSLPSSQRRADAHKRRRRRESPDQISSVGSVKKTERDKQSSDDMRKQSKGDLHCPRELNVASRIVSGTREGTLQITILQDPHPEKEEVKIEESELLETTELTEQANPSVDIEYSDLEDISPGRLSSGNESPATPDTPETAMPAMDFTHPSLGFWAAPLGTNEMAKPVVPAVCLPAVNEEHQASGADVLSPITSYLDDKPRPMIEQSHVHYGLEESGIQKDAVQEPFIAQASWPVEEGFFCQTTTSEERDFTRAVAGQTDVLDEDGEIDTSVDHYYSMSSQESEEDTFRYAQEFPQSEVFEYGHGNLSDQQHESYRSSTRAELRSKHKDYKHRATTRVSRYPWKTQGEGKHSEVAASTGGEGIKLTDQSVTGKSTGSEKSKGLDDNRHAVKRSKMEKGACGNKRENSSDEKSTSKMTSDNESVESDKPRSWEILVFAWLSKSQFTNWFRGKQHQVKLAFDRKGDRNVAQYTPETVRRSTERLLRRAKMRIRQSSCSSSKSPTSRVIPTSDCPDFDFDDLDLETNTLKVPSGQEEESHSCVSKELSLDNMLCSSVNVNEAVEKCNVHSFEHPPMSCTVESEVVHKIVNFDADDACKRGDVICDKEVTVILESAKTEREPPTSKVVHERNKDSTDRKTEQIFDVLSVESATKCKEIEVARSRKSETVDDGKDEQPKERHLVAYNNALSKEESTGGAIVSVNSHDKNAGQTQNHIKGIAEDDEQASVLTTEDTVTEDADDIAQSSCEGDIAEGERNVAEVAENIRVDKNLSLSGNLRDKEGSFQESLSCNLHPQTLSVMDTEKVMGGRSMLATAEHQTNTQPDIKEQRLADGDEAHVTPSLQFADDKEEETNSQRLADEDREHTSTQIPGDETDETNAQMLADGDRAYITTQTVEDTAEEANSQRLADEDREHTTTQTADDKTDETNAQRLADGDRAYITTQTVEDTAEEANSQRLADEDREHTTTQTADDKEEEANATNANKSPFVVSSVLSSDQFSHDLSTANGTTPEDPRVHDLSTQPWACATSLTALVGPVAAGVTAHYPVLPSPPSNFMWPAVTHTSPFPTVESASAHASVQQSNYGLSSWPDHVPHVPFPVGFVQSPAVCDICPPGTEDDSPKASSKPPGSTVSENQSHGSVMDHSVVTALMQFYSEISEVEGSDSNDCVKVNDSTKAMTCGSTPNRPVPAQIRSYKGHGATSDKEVESDLEGSNIDFCEDMDVSDIEQADDPVTENAESLDRPNEEECRRTEMESNEPSTEKGVSAEGISVAPMDDAHVVDSAVDPALVKEPSASCTVSSAVNVMPQENSGVSRDLNVESTLSTAASLLANPGNGNATLVENLDVSSPLGILPLDSPSSTSMEAQGEVHFMSPIDPVFFANAEQTIFSSIGDLKNLLGQSSSFDRIAEEAISLTVSSLEDVLRQAQNSHVDLGNCPSDSGVSAGEEVSVPSKSFSSSAVPVSPLQGPSRSGFSGTTSCVSEDTRAEGSEMSHCTTKVAEKHCAMKKPQKARKKFQFFVYSPEHDRECEAVKNYMLKAGGTFVDIKDSACLEENSRELKVLIRRKHLPSVHRLANLYQLKMASFVKFALFSTLTDVVEGSRLYENIFVSGGALLADDIILKTIEIDHLDALLRYLKEQSLLHQKFVWVLNISRNGYKRLSMNRPLTKRDSKVLNLLRRYRDEGFITVLPKGYVTEGIPATQRYLHTSLKLQIELISVYRHIILLSDMDKSKVEVPWFLERGIGVMNIQEFLATFAGESEAKNLLAKRPQVSCNPEATVKETCTVMECFTPEDETACPTPEGTPVSDSSTDSPVIDSHAVHYSGSVLDELPRTASAGGAPQKRAVRSLSWEPAAPMTQTRLQILSCVRSVRDNIRSQISSSSPSSPVGRSM